MEIQKNPGGRSSRKERSCGSGKTRLGRTGRESARLLKLARSGVRNRNRPLQQRGGRGQVSGSDIRGTDTYSAEDTLRPEALKADPARTDLHRLEEAVGS